MKSYDFGLGWPDVYENDHLFVESLKLQCQERDLSFILVDESIIDQSAAEVESGKLKIKFYLDMASEIYVAEDRFTRFTYSLKDSGCRVVDDPDDVKAAADKSITHFDLLHAKVPVPYTVVIRNWEPTRKLTDEESKNLGFPVVIKPALGYAKKGVKIIKEKFTLEEVAEARAFNPGDNFLLQEFIEPLELEGTIAWFRVFNLFGEIFPCWWNPANNVYRQVTLKEMDTYNLLPMARISSEIGRITRVDWFSSEVAISKKDRKFVVVDYMNDQCAVEPQSRSTDGVPDELLIQFAERIAEKSRDFIKGKFTLSYRAIWFPKIKVKDENV